MNEILHIFRKDVRRHWPEILIGLVLVGLYAKVTLKEPSQEWMATSVNFLRISATSVPPLLVFFWVFLAVRVVQGETLVGDRQWWVTKPYEWWKLLAAKEMFLLVFASAPLFFVQLYLLHHADFPVLTNLGRVVTMQIGLGIVFFLPSVVLGSLTKNVGQAVLGIVAIFVGIWGITALIDKVPNSGMSAAVDGLDEVTEILMLGSLVVAVGWQYARRRTWASRAVVLGAAAVVTLFYVITPYERFVERKYMLAQGNESPVQLAAEAFNPVQKKRSDRLDFLPNVFLRIPFHVSGIAPGHVVTLEGVKVTPEAPDGTKSVPVWKAEWQQIWPEDERTVILYEIKRKEYEGLSRQAVQLHLELAVTEYQETEAREIVLSEGEFVDSQLGICHLNERISSQIDCRRPFHRPGLMASFDGAPAKCQIPEDEKQITNGTVSHAWFAPAGDDALEPGLNPVADYPIVLGSRVWLLSAEATRPEKGKAVHLCAGDRVRIAKPEETRRARVRLDIDGVRLSDLLAGNEFQLH
jgi:hypothetical protein